MSAATLVLFFLALVGVGRAPPDIFKGPVLSDGAGGTWGVALAVALVARVGVSKP